MRSSQEAEGEGWIFGYGSLVWRPGFVFVETSPAWIEGWERRFWQGSTDHRGVPKAPGRVVTLVRKAGAVCWGRAYRVASRDRDATLSALDERERGGYARELLPIHLSGKSQRCPMGLLYRATEGNPNYLGPLALARVAQQVLGAKGPSGTNLEYVTRLAAALREMGVAEDPVLCLDRQLRESAP